MIMKIYALWLLMNLSMNVVELVVYDYMSLDVRSSDLNNQWNENNRG